MVLYCVATYSQYIIKACFYCVSLIDAHCSFQSDGKSCDDINECSNGNGGCQDTCTNKEGSFICSCDDGYELTQGKQCQGMCSIPVVSVTYPRGFMGLSDLVV